MGSLQRAYERATESGRAPCGQLAAYCSAFAASAAILEDDAATARLWLRTGAGHFAQAIRSGTRLDASEARHLTVLAALTGEEELLSECSRLKAPRGKTADARLGTYALALALRADPTVPERINAWGERVQRGDASAGVRATQEHLPALAAAALTTDREELAAAAVARSGAWARLARDPLLRAHPQGLVDFDGLAWLAVARRSGVTAPPDGVYLPVQMLG